MVSRFQRGVSIALFIVGSFFLAQGVITITNRPNLGSIIRNIAGPLLFLAGGAVLQTNHFSKLFSAYPSFPKSGGWRFMIIALLGGAAGVGVIEVLAEAEAYGGMLTVFGVLLAIIGAGIMIFLKLTGRDVWALAMLFFLQSLWSSYLVKWEGQWLFLPFVAVMFLRMALDRKLPDRTSFDGIIVLILLIFLISSLASKDPAISLSGFLKHMVIPCLWFLIVVNTTRNSDDVILAIWALAVSRLVDLGIRYYFWLQAEGWNPFADLGYQYVEITGGGGGIAANAAYTVPFVIGCCLLGRTLWHKMGWVTAVGFLASLLLTAGTRSAMLATVLISMLLLFHSRPVRRAYTALVGLSISILVLSPTIWSADTLQRLQRWTSLSAAIEDQSMRLDAWQAAIRMTIEHPWLGIGLEMWPEYNPLYGGRFILTQAHNTLLNYASAGGVGALIAILALIGLVTWKGLRLWQGCKDSIMRAIALAGLWAVWVEVINGVIGGAWYFSQTFWIGMGIIAVVERIRHLRHSGPVPSETNGTGQW